MMTLLAGSAAYFTVPIGGVFEACPPSPTLKVVGGLLLSFPATGLVGKLSAWRGVRIAFVLDCFIFSLGLCWLSWGIVLLRDSSASDDETAPLLWWSCFVQVVFGRGRGSAPVGLPSLRLGGLSLACSRCSRNHCDVLCCIWAGQHMSHSQLATLATCLKP